MRLRDVKIGEEYSIHADQAEPAIASRIETIYHKAGSLEMVVLEFADGSEEFSYPDWLKPWSERQAEQDYERLYFDELDRQGEELSEIIGGKVLFDEGLNDRHMLGLDETAALALLEKLDKQPPKPNPKATRQSQLSRAIRRALGFGYAPGWLIEPRFDAFIFLSDQEIEQLKEKLGHQAKGSTLAGLIA